jgi:hypothetical protein
VLQLGGKDPRKATYTTSGGVPKQEVTADMRVTLSLSFTYLLILTVSFMTRVTKAVPTSPLAVTSLNKIDVSRKRQPKLIEAWWDFPDS